MPKLTVSGSTPPLSLYVFMRRLGTALPLVYTVKLPPMVKKGKVPHWGTTTPQPQGLLCSHPEGVPSFISRGAAHRTVGSAAAPQLAKEGTM
jgi:hypothetical protein